MNLTPIENSSNIDAAGYDGSNLHVKFKTGQTVYLYKAVPQDVATGFFNAESKGKYFAANIKGKYESEKMG